MMKAPTMELILWRHAEAEPGTPDDARILTAKGHKQAWRMAEWLDANLPDRCRILSSPAVRTVQTAEALGRKFKVSPALGTETTVEQVLAAIGWPDGREPVLIVGHQPTLGLLASQLLTGTQQAWTVRKANAWWIGQRDRSDQGNDSTRPSPTDHYLRAVMTPELVRK